MVRPITRRPRWCRRAATVELSTPPLMATAMGALDMGMRNRRDLAQMLDLLGGVGAAEREADTRARAVDGQADRRKHVRWLDGAARTGCTGRHRESAQVEGDDQRFPFEVVEINVAGIGRARGAPSTDARIRDTRENSLFETVSQGVEPGPFGGLVLAHPLGRAA